MLALAYAICGMVLGIYMAASHDHSEMPVHAHTMVAGWVMSAIFAYFYHLFPAIGGSRMALVHFWVQAVSGVVLVVSLFFLLAGNGSRMLMLKPSPEKHIQLGKANARAMWVPSAAIADGKLLLRGRKGIICYGLTASGPTVGGL